MEINIDTSVGEIVKANFKTAQIFDKNKIDFCCGGGISLDEACKKSNIDINQLVPELDALVKQSDPDSKYIDGLELNELCDYIEKDITLMQVRIFHFFNKNCRSFAMFMVKIIRSFLK